MSDDLASLIERVDLAALVETYAGPGRREGATVKFRCPNPGHPDQSPSFTVNRNRRGRQVATCWSQCDWHGDALELVKWLDNCTTREAADKLRAFVGDGRRYDPIRRTSTPPTPSRASTVVAVRELPDTATRPRAETADRLLNAYLAKRGWGREVADRFGLQVVVGRGGHPFVRHPFFAFDGEGRKVVAAWQDRRCHDTEGASRWDTPSGVSLPLYNEPALYRENLELVVICEGPADAVSAEVALARFPNAGAVATAGANGWRYNFRERYGPLFDGKTVLVVADRDPAGDGMRSTVSLDLRSVAKRCRVVTPPTKDLTDWCNEVGFDRVGELLVKAAGLSKGGPGGAPRRVEPDTTQSNDPYQRAFDLLAEAGLSPRWVEMAVAA